MSLNIFKKKKDEMITFTLKLFSGMCRTNRGKHGWEEDGLHLVKICTHPCHIQKLSRPAPFSLSGGFPTSILSSLILQSSTQLSVKYVLSPPHSPVFNPIVGCVCAHACVWNSSSFWGSSKKK